MDNEKKFPKPAVETYASDMAEALQGDREGSAIKKIIQSEEEREQEKRTLPESRRNKVLMAISCILFALGAGVILYFYENKSIGIMDVRQEVPPLIFIDKSTYIETLGLKEEEIVNAIVNRRAMTDVKPGGIEGIYLTANRSVLGLRQFIQLLNFHFAPNENPVIVSDNFLLGHLRHSAPDVQGSGFFILLKARSSADIFDALRDWEANMFHDLRGIAAKKDPSDDDLLGRAFEDDIFENKNARVLRDAEKNIVLIYVFADNNSVVIADSPAAAHEVLLRLASKQTKE